MNKFPCVPTWLPNTICQCSSGFSIIYTMVTTLTCLFLNLPYIYCSCSVSDTVKVCHQGPSKHKRKDLFEGIFLGFPGGSLVKNSPANIGDIGSIPALGRHPGEENSNPLRYSCLENPTLRGAWWAMVHGFAKRRTQLSY